MGNVKNDKRDRMWIVMFREVSRKKQALTPEECFGVLERVKRGVLSVNGDLGYPYGMPMDHWYDRESGKIYFHCGKKGHRTDALKRDPRASYCVTEELEKKPGEWAIDFNSVIVFGKIEVIEDLKTVEDTARKLSLRFTEDTDCIEKEIERFASSTAILALSAEHITGKTVNES